MAKRKQYSSIWGHYTQSIEGNFKFATCNYCCQRFKTCGTTTTLWRHFRTKHVKIDSTVEAINVFTCSPKSYHGSVPPIFDIPVHLNIEKCQSDIGTIVIGIAGGSGAGKTTLSDAISETIGVNSIIHLPHDSYYESLPESYYSYPLKSNFNHPSSFETELLISHIHKLKQGISVNVPTYDYYRYQRIKNESTLMKPKRVIIVEGILIFSYTKLVQELDVKIYVDTPSNKRHLRKIRRDTSSRRPILSQVLQQDALYPEAMFQKYVEPSKFHANIIVNGNQDLTDTKDVIVSYIRDKLGEKTYRINHIDIYPRNNYEIFKEPG